MCLVAARLIPNTPSIRLYSTQTMKPLGTLRYHKTGCQAVEFAHSPEPDEAGSLGDEAHDSDDGEEMDEREKEERARWLVAGGKDFRVSIWALMKFTK